MGKLPLNIHSWFGKLPGLIEDMYKGCSSSLENRALDKTIYDLLQTNFKVWGYEDEVRRNDLPDKDIACLKRNIDRDNQKRNDLADRIDFILREDIDKKLGKINPSAPLNSETPGSVFDRLTILALRSYNLKKEIARKDTAKSHIDRCSGMLEEVEERSNDLVKCLEELLVDYYSGRKRLKSYKQHKLYNDPELNPSLRK